MAHTKLYSNEENFYLTILESKYSIQRFIRLLLYRQMRIHLNVRPHDPATQQMFQFCTMETSVVHVV